MDHNSYMKKACMLSERSVGRGTGPFGAIIIDKKTGEEYGTGHNLVTLRKDPTLHAEIVAISNACHYLQSIDLSNCILYTSCEPCPMCLSAIYLTHIDTVYYGNTKEDAARIGFDDQFIYDEIAKPIEQRQIKMIPLGKENAATAFQLWENKEDKVHY
jgi:guanine deaminase